MALRKFIDTNVFSDPKLHTALSDSTLDDVAKSEYLADHLRRTVSLKSDLEGADPKVMKERFYSFANRLYHNGTADGLTSLATGCGLVSKRGTNRYRYAPTDDLLRALVLANLAFPMEESAFLRHIHGRYRMVLGPSEAKEEVRSQQFDETDFKRNRDRLVRHLIGMGLAQRMSDACTYIINPMESRK